MPWYLDGGFLTLVVVAVCIIICVIRNPEINEDEKAMRDGFHIYSKPENKAGGGGQ